MSLLLLALLIVYILVILYSVVIHEASHAAAADYLGDPTARNLGRLTLNPLVHLDLWGSFLVPLGMLLLTGGRFVFGWAKPVPFNPYNLRNQRYGPSLVALAGPASNILLALGGSILARILPIASSTKAGIISSTLAGNWPALFELLEGNVFAALFLILAMIVVLNLILAAFNLIPIPPLDGSKLLLAFDMVSQRTYIMLERYGLLILIFVLFSGILTFLFRAVFSLALFLLGV
jgi:Zn-dependent protease